MDRDIFWDNAKVVMIFCVVFGHMLEITLNNRYCELFWVIIYSFHMPFFCFISGYFSKNVNNSRDTAFEKFFITYMVFNTIYSLLARNLNIFTPSYVYWYLLSMLFWKIALKDLIKIKYIIPIAILTAIFAGIFQPINRFLSISRTLSFLPFFLIGYYFNSNLISRLKKIPRYLCAIFIVVIVSGIILLYENGLFPRSILWFAESYNDLGLSVINGIFVRFVAMIVASILCICLYRLIPSKKTCFSIVGRYTLYVYLLHPYIIMLMKRFNFFKDFNTIFLMIFYFVLSVITIYLFGNKHIDKVYKFVFDRINLVIIKK